MIDRHYRLEAIIAAHRQADTGRKKDNVVITVVQNNETYQNDALNRYHLRMV